MIPCYYTSQCLITSAVFLFKIQTSDSPCSEEEFAEDTTYQAEAQVIWLMRKHLELNLFNWRCYSHGKEKYYFNTNLLLTI